MLWYISQILYAVYLLVLSVLDVRSRKLPNRLLAAGTFLAVGNVFLAEVVLAGEHTGAVRKLPLFLVLSGAAVGAGFFLISKVTGEAIGYGDSWLISSLGIYLGLWKLLEMLLYTWCFLAAASVFCLVKKQYRRKASLPMVPFLAAGYLLVWLGG